MKLILMIVLLIYTVITTNLFCNTNKTQPYKRKDKAVICVHFNNK